MKQLIKLISVILLIVSCDDKIKELNSLNLNPTLEYFSRTTTNWTPNNGTIVKDSAKIYTSENNLNYTAVLRAKDPNNNFGSVVIETVDLQDKFFVDNEQYLQYAQVKLDSFSIAYRNGVVDTKQFSIIAYDDFNEFDKITFDVTFVENKLPIPLLEINLTNNQTTNEYHLDGSKSKDGDQRLGGFIREYEFIIDHDIINTPESVISHVFSKGTHEVSLRVKDNDGIWSEKTTQTITIN